MERIAAGNKVIDMTAYFDQRRRDRRQDCLHRIFALWTQYLAVGMLVLYGLLRLVLCTAVPVGSYAGPLSLLWVMSFLLLATSYFSDILLWREE